jgi:hypothetical protein
VNVEDNPRFTLGQRLVLAVVPRLVWALFRVVGLTWRFEVIAEEGVTPVLFGQKPGPEIYCFWHQCVLPCTVYFRHSLAVILISRSFDGELITRTLRLFGFDAVRGSSSSRPVAPQSSPPMVRAVPFTRRRWAPSNWRR